MITKRLNFKKWLAASILPFAASVFPLLIILASEKEGNGVGSVGAAAGIANFLVVCFIFFALYSLFFSVVCFYLYSFKDSTNHQNKIWYFFKLLLLALTLTPLFIAILAFCINSLQAYLSFSFFHSYHWLIWGFGLFFVSAINSLFIPSISLRRLKITVVAE